VFIGNCEGVQSKVSTQADKKYPSRYFPSETVATQGIGEGSVASSQVFGQQWLDKGTVAFVYKSTASGAAKVLHLDLGRGSVFEFQALGIELRLGAFSYTQL
jgi:hypothetical protein